MSNGGIIGKENNPDTSTASGVWTLPEHYSAVKSNLWPSSAPSIQLVGSATASLQSWSFASNAITGVQSGDLLILVTSDDLSSDPTPTTGGGGWRIIYNDTAFDGTSQAGLFYRYATDSDVSATASGDNASDASAAVMIAFRNAILDDAVVITHVSETAADVDDPASINADVNDWVLAIAHAQDHNGTTTLTAPSGYTDINDIASDNGATTYAWTYVAYKEITSLGTEDPPAFGGTLGAANFMRCTTVRLLNNTVLFYSDGSSLSGWTNGSGAAAATVQTTGGNPAQCLEALGSDYAYYDLGQSFLNKKITVDMYAIDGAGANDLANFYFGCNSSGQGNMFRIDSRSAAYSGISTTTSWTSWNAPTSSTGTLATILTNTWYRIELSINSSSQLTWSINGTTYGTNVSITLQGNYFGIHGDDSAFSVGGARFDNIRIEDLS